jgi:hypothetical protein
MPLSNRTCFQVNLRDGLICRLCGRAPQTQQNYHRGFEYHHVMPQSEGGPDVADNLILLCHDCHLRHHGNKLLLPPPGDLTVPEQFACKRCNATLSTDTVEMNCGWYRCGNCGETTHLFGHCGFDEDV